MFQEFLTFIEGLRTPVTIPQAVVSIGFSLLASIAAYFMYQFFYGSRHIGAGVHRFFLVGGPAITALFLAIQVSIPLSLGMVGSLSFIRFRTPIKDPAEIGFLLLLIASSVGAATHNFLATILLFVLVFFVLLIQWLTRNRISLFGRGNLMISIDQASFSEIESRLTSFLKEKLGGIKLDTMSVIDNRVSLNYQYRRKSDFNTSAFVAELKQLSSESNLEIFIG